MCFLREMRPRDKIHGKKQQEFNELTANADPDSLVAGDASRFRELDFRWRLKNRFSHVLS